MSRTQVKRAYKYRFYPTEQQRTELLRTFGCVRKVYNLALEARTRAWFAEQRRVNYAETSKLLTEWKRSDELSYLGEVSSVPLQQALRHLQTAFSNFFGKQARYPRFKSRKKSRQSAEYTKSGFKWRDGQLTLAKMREPLAIVWSRLLPEGAEPSTVTVSRDAADRWFVSFLVETSTEHLPATDTAVGVDAGLDSLATLSTGEKITNPKHERRDRKLLAKAQRELSRKDKGSNNRAKARRKVARVHARITDRRKDHLHKVTTRLVRENQTVVIEDLQVRNMLGNHSLARAISDASWSEFRTMLEYKATWYGREVVAVDRWFPSSKTCSACGRLAEAMPLHLRTWTCSGCGTTHDRDVNAATNIKAAGLAVSACGAGVRPQRESSRTGQLAGKQELSGASRKGIPALQGGE
ncbi:RNA-guided endonuclease InsQ/TnpB family protein [Bounagaea algeriensis]